MRVRQLGVLIAIVMVALGLYAPPASAAIPIPPTQLCIVQAKVTFKDLQETWWPGPGPATPTLYNLVGVNVVCVGINMVGICDVTSHGDTAPVMGRSGGFSGLFTASCTLGSCSGSVGGPNHHTPEPVPGLTGDLPPNPQTTVGPWSYTRGPIIMGLITANCTDGPMSGQVAGIVILVAVPDPTLTTLPPTLSDTNGDGIPDQVLISYTSIRVAGVAILG